MTQAEVRKMFVQAKPGVRLPGRKGFWYRCAHCGKWCGRPGGEKAKIPDDYKMEVDHIRPFAQGGNYHALYNLQPLCKPCNRAKSSNMTFKDNVKAAKNAVFHPLDAMATPVRKAARNNKILKGLGITKRR